MAAIRSSLPFTLLALAACGQEQQETARRGLPVSLCEERRFEGSAFTACKYDPAAHRLEMFVEGADGQPLRDFAALEAHLGKRAQSLLFAMNGGMYDDEGRPIGLFVARGEERRRINRRDGGGNFHLKPNGVFWADEAGTPRVTAADDFRANPFWATQSGPMLVIEGRLHPAFQPNGESLHIRNGVGACAGNVAWFAISEEPVSFGRFARLFRDELECPDALFLDGSVSSLWEAGVRQDRHAPLGPMIAVFRR